MHIRRTDKVGTEAAFHPIHEYMAHVHDYYAQLELTAAVDERRVYIATDDASVSHIRTDIPTNIRDVYILLEGLVLTAGTVDNIYIHGYVDFYK